MLLCLRERQRRGERGETGTGDALRPSSVSFEVLARRGAIKIVSRSIESVGKVKESHETGRDYLAREEDEERTKQRRVARAHFGRYLFPPSGVSKNHRPWGS